MTTTVVTPCTNPKIGGTLKMLDFSFSASPPERQAEYLNHLRECNFCAAELTRVMNRKRLIGLGITFGGLALALVSLFIVWFQYTQTEMTVITIPHGLFLLGLALFGKGIWQLIRGKSSDQK